VRNREQFQFDHVALMAKSKRIKKTRREFLQVPLGADARASTRRDAASDQPLSLAAG